MDLVLSIIYWVIGACFAAAATMATIRIVRGPSIVDRMVGSDTFATVLICVMSADMAIRGHTTTLPLVLGLAMTASVGTMAVARFVSRGGPRNIRAAERELARSIPAGNTKATPESDNGSSTAMSQSDVEQSREEEDR